MMAGENDFEGMADFDELEAMFGAADPEAEIVRMLEA